MIAIDGLHELEQALARLSLDATLHRAFKAAASFLQDTVQAELSHRPGGDHTFPWFRSGALHDSVGHQADASGAVIGSNDPVAVYQEAGTRTDPPRPFFAAAASVHAEPIADSIGASVGAAIRGAVR